MQVVASACIWVDGSTLDGKPRGNNATSLEFLFWAIKKTPAENLGSLVHSASDGEFSKQEKEAVKKMLSNEAAEAVPLLLQNEQESPNQYSTAANLGTAYELSGDNRNALKWISEGIRRNPLSHYGTEWLHALILETKLRLEKEPDYLKAHRIIPLPETFESETKVNVGGAERTVGEIAFALNDQLRERVVFVKPPDPIVADLLYTYALCEAHTAVLENALKLLKKSEDYGFLEPDLIEATADSYQPMIEKARKKRKMIAPVQEYWVAFVLVAGVLGYVASLWWRWKKKRRREAKAES